MAKGFIFKYHADPYDSNMRDKLGTARGCGLAIRDPDFWSNDYPVWAVCGPYYRKVLGTGDIVFFVPIRAAIRKAGLDGYVCTGILVVAEKLPGPEAVMLDPRLTKEYKKKYRADLTAHLEKDNVRTKKIRSCNFVLGDSSKSKWFGRNQKYLYTTLQELGLHSIAGKLSFQRIPPLKEQQVRSLYKRLVGKEL